MDINVMMDYEFDRMDTNVKGWIPMWISVGYKLKDGYQCKYRMDTNVKGWIPMWISVGYKLKDGYQCEYRLNIS